MAEHRDVFYALRAANKVDRCATNSDHIAQIYGSKKEDRKEGRFEEEAPLTRAAAISLRILSKGKAL